MMSTARVMHQLGAVGAACLALLAAAPSPASAGATRARVSTEAAGQLDQCSGTTLISCHYDYAPGHYDVTVVLGDDSEPGETTVQAEQRRTMLGPVTTAAGSLQTYRFTVNVRDPEGEPTGDGGVGTPGLTLVFGGSAPKLHAIDITAAAPRVLYLIGDSTVCDQPGIPYTGWGQQLPQFFGPGLSVANYADSGESTGSFLDTDALWPTMRPLITPNDYVFIQLAHNDKQVTKETYQANLTALVQGVAARGATPVLVTPPVRRWFTGDTLNSTGLIVNNLGVDLPAAMREVAAAQGVPLIDLTDKSRALVEGLGPDDSGRIYLTAEHDGVNDKTHFSEYGANELARLVVEGTREAGLTGLTDFLR